MRASESRTRGIGRGFRPAFSHWLDLVVRPSTVPSSRAAYALFYQLDANEPTSAYEYNGTGQLDGRVVKICY